jgi:hypothetical protein
MQAVSSNNVPHRKASTLRLAVVLTILVGLLPPGAPAVRDPSISYTVSQPLPAGFVSLAEASFSLLSFRQRYLFPHTSLDLRLHNNSLLLPLSASCRGAITAAAIVPLDGGPWNSNLVDGVTALDPNNLVIEIRGYPAFYLEGRKRYSLQLPAACTVTVSSPAPVEFSIENGKRTQLGRAYTFLYLVSACFAALATFGGSLTALAGVQLATAVTSCGCGPVELQDEFSVLVWTIVPTHLPSSERDENSDFNMLATNMIVLLIIGVLELVYLAVLLKSTSYFDHLKAAFSSDKNVHGVETKDREGERWRHRFPLPGYILLCVSAGLNVGIVRFGIRTMLQTSEGQRLLLAFAGVAGGYVVFPLLTLGISRNRAMALVPYQASKGRIPRWLQPAGVWGGNVLRLVCGILFEDFDKGRRAAGAGLLIFSGIVAGVTGSNPRSLDSCRNTAWLVAVLSCVFVAYLHFFRPYRAKFFNHGHIASFGLFAAFAGLYLVKAGYFYDVEDHWSLSALFVVGICHACCTAVLAVAHLVVSVWEARGGQAFRHVNGDVGRFEADGINAMLMQLSTAGVISALGGTARSGSPKASSPMNRTVSFADEPSPSRRGGAPGAADHDDSDDELVLTRRGTAVDEREESPSGGGGGRGRAPSIAGSSTSGVALPMTHLDRDSAGMYHEMLAFFAENPTDELTRDVAAQANARAGVNKTLADFLLEDYDALPQSTREEMILWERLSRARREDNRRHATTNGRLLSDMVVHPEVLRDLNRLPVQPRERPPVNVQML